MQCRNPFAVQKTWDQFLGLEVPLEKEMATHSRILALKNPMERGAWQAIAHGVTRVGHDLTLQISTFLLHITSMSVLYLACWIEQRLVHSAWINIPWRIKAFYWEILPENRNFVFTNKTMNHPNTLKEKCILNFNK